MTRGTRIVAVESAEPVGELVLDTPVADAEPAEAADDWWEDAPARAARPWRAIIAGTLTVLAVAGWSALFFIANQASMLAGGSIVQWSGWLRDWSAPVLLLALVWLIAMRNSRREAQRFGETARLLGEESARLEARMTTVNRELSLAREFISAQSRDIESLGRVATERLAQHSDKLASLIHDNGTRIDAIQTVSASALENMENLRSHLPVIASSAKDVTNNIGTAGRAAHGQVEELIAGFHKLNQFGQASERQVNSLRDVVDRTLAEFTRQAEQLGAIADNRFAALTEKGAEFRTQLDSQEVEALAAIRSRANALAAELEETRKVLDTQEGEALISLGSRLGAVREESAAIGRSLSEGEGKALEAWRNATSQLEQDLTQAIAKVGDIDERAMASARNQLGELAREAEELDSRMDERDQLFAAEIERRRAEFESRHGEFIAQLSSQMADFDREIEQRHSVQQEHGRKLVSNSETVAVQLDHFSHKMAEVAAVGGEAEDRLAASLAALGDKLAASREALTGTDRAVAELTDGSVRLLELIQAGVQHSSHDLPQAMGANEARLAVFEARVSTLSGQLDDADSKGQAVAGHIAESTAALAKVSELTGQLEQRVAHARAKAEDQVDNDFARRVALITESLNSHAIDIARAVASDVSDTTWASYLKGDRGVFTRRAVRLLEAGEAKAVAQLYEQDPVFGDHVSRYIHDFEAMLRQLLSTRDGHALGVTLLSSDMGKLYVVLAQSIERLRN